MKFYIAGIGIFDLFGFCDLDLDPMTFIYELDPHCLEIYERTACVKMKVLYYVHSFERYRLTDRQTYIQTHRHDQNYTPRRFAFADGQLNRGTKIHLTENPKQAANISTH